MCASKGLRYASIVTAMSFSIFSWKWMEQKCACGSSIGRWGKVAGPRCNTVCDEDTVRKYFQHPTRKDLFGLHLVHGLRTELPCVMPCMKSCNLKRDKKECTRDHWSPPTNGRWKATVGKHWVDFPDFDYCDPSKQIDCHGCGGIAKWGHGYRPRTYGPFYGEHYGVVYDLARSRQDAQGYLPYEGERCAKEDNQITKQLIACDSATSPVRCDRDHTIVVKEAFYGRKKAALFCKACTTGSICAGSNENNVTQEIAAACDNHQACTILVCRSSLKLKGCPGVKPLYLQLEYICKPTGNVTVPKAPLALTLPAKTVLNIAVDPVELNPYKHPWSGPKIIPAAADNNTMYDYGWKWYAGWFGRFAASREPPHVCAHMAKENLHCPPGFNATLGIKGRYVDRCGGNTNCLSCWKRVKKTVNGKNDEQTVNRRERAFRQKCVPPSCKEWCAPENANTYLMGSSRSGKYLRNSGITGSVKHTQMIAQCTKTVGRRCLNAIDNNPKTDLTFHPGGSVTLQYPTARRWTEIRIIRPPTTDGGKKTLNSNVFHFRLQCHIDPKLGTGLSSWHTVLDTERPQREGCAIGDAHYESKGCQNWRKLFISHFLQKHFNPGVFVLKLTGGNPWPADWGKNKLIMAPCPTDGVSSTWRLSRIVPAREDCTSVTIVDMEIK